MIFPHLVLCFGGEFAAEELAFFPPSPLTFFLTLMDFAAIMLKLLATENEKKHVVKHVRMKIFTRLNIWYLSRIFYSYSIWKRISIRIDLGFDRPIG